MCEMRSKEAVYGELKYSEIEYSCINGGKVFKSTSMMDERSTKVSRIP